MFNAPEIISAFRQVGNFQGNQIDVCSHCLDVLKNLIGVEQDFSGNDVRLILRLRGHVV